MLPLNPLRIGVVSQTSCYPTTMLWEQARMVPVKERRGRWHAVPVQGRGWVDSHHLLYHKIPRVFENGENRGEKGENRDGSDSSL